MKKSRSILLILLAISFVVAACAPQSAVPTPTLSAPQATSTVAATATATPVGLTFEYTVHSTRDEPALERVRFTWEGSYIWTPFVVFENEIFHLFYNGYTTSTQGIGYATSINGANFERAVDEPILDSEEEDREIFSPLVYVDDDGLWVMYIINDDWRGGLAGDRVMRYTAADPQGPWGISNQGEPVYQAPSAEHWTNSIVIRSIVVEEGQILLGFDARHDDTISIGILRSEDGLSFDLLSPDPVLIKGAAESWEQDAVSAPMIFATDDGYEMFYMGFVKDSLDRFRSHEGENLWLGYATSEDGINWEKDDQNPIMNIPEEEGTAYISGMKVEDTYYIYYVYGQGAYGIGAASLQISSDN